MEATELLILHHNTGIINEMLTNDIQILWIHPLWPIESCRINALDYYVFIAENDTTGARLS